MPKRPSRHEFEMKAPIQHKSSQEDSTFPMVVHTYIFFANGLEVTPSYLLKYNFFKDVPMATKTRTALEFLEDLRNLVFKKLMSLTDDYKKKSRFFPKSGLTLCEVEQIIKEVTM